MNADTTIATLIGDITLYDSLARNTINMMKATPARIESCSSFLKAK
tara:strand:- start:271 stop:408 length:138 start_codon:yes stop_codon:yes gene_type:complete